MRFFLVYYEHGDENDEINTRSENKNVFSKI